MAGDPLVSCCMIVRDEAHNLPDCFASTEALVDQWIVLDTGSRDGTAALASDFGATVLHDPWRDDFAHSRNLSLEPATGTWILVLDADDRIQDPAALRRHLEAGPEADVHFLQVRSRVETDRGTAWESFWRPLVFRRSAGVRYRYPAHAVPVLDHLTRAPAPGRIDHQGYVTAEARQGKAERTLRILARLDPDDPHRAYQELRAHAIRRDWQAVLAAAEHLRSVLRPIPPDAWTLEAQALLKDGRPADAARCLAEGLSEHPEHPDLYYALMATGGVGFAGAARTIQRRGGLYDGLATTLSRVPQTLAGLVDLGLMDPRILQTELATFGVDGFTHPH